MSKEATKPEVISQELAPWLGVLPLIKTSQETAEDMMAQILNASSIDQVLAVSETVGLADLVGEVITVHSATLRESELDAGYPVYAVIQATSHNTGEPITVTTGAGKVLAQLAKLTMMNALPTAVRVISIQSASDKSRRVLQFAATETF